MKDARMKSINLVQSTEVECEQEKGACDILHIKNYINEHMKIKNNKNIKRLN